MTLWEGMTKPSSGPGGMSHRKATRVETASSRPCAHACTRQAFPCGPQAAPFPGGRETDGRGRGCFPPNSQMKELTPRTGAGLPGVSHGDAPGADQLPCPGVWLPLQPLHQPPRGFRAQSFSASPLTSICMPKSQLFI